MPFRGIRELRRSAKLIIRTQARNWAASATLLLLALSAPQAASPPVVDAAPIPFTQAELHEVLSLRFEALQAWQQRAYLEALREFVADDELERALDEAELGASRSTASSMSAASAQGYLAEPLLRMLDQLTVGSALADGDWTTSDDDKDCFNAGWPSEIVKSGRARLCAAPTAANNEFFRAIGAGGDCPSGKIACTPALFGRSGAGTCVAAAPASKTMDACVRQFNLSGCGSNPTCLNKILSDVQGSGQVAALFNATRNRIKSSCSEAAIARRPSIAASCGELVLHLKLLSGKAVVNQDCQPMPASLSRIESTPAKPYCIATLTAGEIKVVDDAEGDYRALVKSIKAVTTAQSALANVSSTGCDTNPGAPTLDTTANRTLASTTSTSTLNGSGSFTGVTTTSDPAETTGAATTTSSTTSSNGILTAQLPGCPGVGVAGEKACAEATSAYARYLNGSTDSDEGRKAFSQGSQKNEQRRQAAQNGNRNRRRANTSQRRQQPRPPQHRPTGKPSQKVVQKTGIPASYQKQVNEQMAWCKANPVACESKYGKTYKSQFSTRVFENFSAVTKGVTDKSVKEENERKASAATAQRNLAAQRSSLLGSIFPYSSGLGGLLGLGNRGNAAPAGPTAASGDLRPGLSVARANRSVTGNASVTGGNSRRNRNPSGDSSFSANSIFNRQVVKPNVTDRLFGGILGPNAALKPSSIKQAQDPNKADLPFTPVQYENRKKLGQDLITQKRILVTGDDMRASSDLRNYAAGRSYRMRSDQTEDSYQWNRDRREQFSDKLADRYNEILNGPTAATETIPQTRSDIVKLTSAYTSVDREALAKDELESFRVVSRRQLQQAGIQAGDGYTDTNPAIYSQEKIDKFLDALVAKVPDVPPALTGNTSILTTAKKTLTDGIGLTSSSIENLDFSGFPTGTRLLTDKEREDLLMETLGTRMTPSAWLRNQKLLTDTFTPDITAPNAATFGGIETDAGLQQRVKLELGDANYQQILGNARLRENPYEFTPDDWHVLDDNQGLETQARMFAVGMRYLEESRDADRAAELSTKEAGRQRLKDATGYTFTPMARLDVLASKAPDKTTPAEEAQLLRAAQNAPRAFQKLGMATRKDSVFNNRDGGTLRNASVGSDGDDMEYVWQRFRAGTNQSDTEENFLRFQVAYGEALAGEREKNKDNPSYEFTSPWKVLLNDKSEYGKAVLADREYFAKEGLRDDNGKPLPGVDIASFWSTRGFDRVYAPTAAEIQERLSAAKAKLMEQPPGPNKAGYEGGEKGDFVKVSETKDLRLKVKFNGEEGSYEDYLLATTVAAKRLTKGLSQQDAASEAITELSARLASGNQPQLVAGASSGQNYDPLSLYFMSHARSKEQRGAIYATCRGETRKGCVSDGSEITKTRLIVPTLELSLSASSDFVRKLRSDQPREGTREETIWTNAKGEPCGQSQGCGTRTVTVKGVEQADAAAPALDPKKPQLEPTGAYNLSSGDEPVVGSDEQVRQQMVRLLYEQAITDDIVASGVIHSTDTKGGNEQAQSRLANVAVLAKYPDPSKLFLLDAQGRMLSAQGERRLIQAYREGKTVAVQPNSIQYGSALYIAKQDYKQRLDAYRATQEPTYAISRAFTSWWELPWNKKWDQRIVAPLAASIAANGQPTVGSSAAFVLSSLGTTEVWNELKEATPLETQLAEERAMTGAAAMAPALMYDLYSPIGSVFGLSDETKAWLGENRQGGADPRLMPLASLDPDLVAGMNKNAQAYESFGRVIGSTPYFVLGAALGAATGPLIATYLAPAIAGWIGGSAATMAASEAVAGFALNQGVMIGQMAIQSGMTADSYRKINGKYVAVNGDNTKDDFHSALDRAYKSAKMMATIQVLERFTHGALRFGLEARASVAMVDGVATKAYSNAARKVITEESLVYTNARMIAVNGGYGVQECLHGGGTMDECINSTAISSAHMLLAGLGTHAGTKGATSAYERTLEARGSMFVIPRINADGSIADVGLRRTNGQYHADETIKINPKAVRTEPVHAEILASTVSRIGVNKATGEARVFSGEVDKGAGFATVGKKGVITPKSEHGAGELPPSMLGNLKLTGQELWSGNVERVKDFAGAFRSGGLKGAREEIQARRETRDLAREAQIPGQYERENRAITETIARRGKRLAEIDERLESPTLSSDERAGLEAEKHAALKQDTIDQHSLAEAKVLRDRVRAEEINQSVKERSEARLDTNISERTREKLAEASRQASSNAYRAAVASGYAPMVVEAANRAAQAEKSVISEIEKSGGDAATIAAQTRAVREITNQKVGETVQGATQGKSIDEAVRLALPDRAAIPEPSTSAATAAHVGTSLSVEYTVPITGEKQVLSVVEATREIESLRAAAKEAAAKPGQAASDESAMLLSKASALQEALVDKAGLSGLSDRAQRLLFDPAYASENAKAIRNPASVKPSEALAKAIGERLLAQDPFEVANVGARTLLDTFARMQAKAAADGKSPAEAFESTASAIAKELEIDVAAARLWFMQGESAQRPGRDADLVAPGLIAWNLSHPEKAAFFQKFMALEADAPASLDKLEQMRSLVIRAHNEANDVKRRWLEENADLVAMMPELAAQYAPSEQSGKAFAESVFGKPDGIYKSDIQAAIRRQLLESRPANLGKLLAVIDQYPAATEWLDPAADSIPVGAGQRHDPALARSQGVVTFLDDAGKIVVGEIVGGHPERANRVAVKTTDGETVWTDVKSPVTLLQGDFGRIPSSIEPRSWFTMATNNTPLLVPTSASATGDVRGAVLGLTADGQALRVLQADQKLVEVPLSEVAAAAGAGRKIAPVSEAVDRALAISQDNLAAAKAALEKSDGLIKLNAKGKGPVAEATRALADARAELRKQRRLPAADRQVASQGVKGVKDLKDARQALADAATALHDAYAARRAAETTIRLETPEVARLSALHAQALEQQLLEKTEARQNLGELEATPAPSELGKWKNVIGKLSSYPREGQVVRVRLAGESEAHYYEVTSTFSNKSKKVAPGTLKLLGQTAASGGSVPQDLAFDRSGRILSAGLANEPLAGARLQVSDSKLTIKPANREATIKKLAAEFEADRARARVESANAERKRLDAELLKLESDVVQARQLVEQSRKAVDAGKSARQLKREARAAAVANGAPAGRVAKVVAVVRASAASAAALASMAAASTREWIAQTYVGQTYGVAKALIARLPGMGERQPAAMTAAETQARGEAIGNTGTIAPAKSLAPLEARVKTAEDGLRLAQRQLKQASSDFEKGTYGKGKRAIEKIEARVARGELLLAQARAELAAAKAAPAEPKLPAEPAPEINALGQIQRDPLGEGEQPALALPPALAAFATPGVAAPQGWIAGVKSSIRWLSERLMPGNRSRSMIAASAPAFEGVLAATENPELGRTVIANAEQRAFLEEQGRKLAELTPASRAPAKITEIERVYPNVYKWGEKPAVRVSELTSDLEVGQHVRLVREITDGKSSGRVVGRQEVIGSVVRDGNGVTTLDVLGRKVALRPSDKIHLRDRLADLGAPTEHLGIPVAERKAVDSYDTIRMRSAPSDVELVSTSADGSRQVIYGKAMKVADGDQLAITVNGKELVQVGLSDLEPRAMSFEEVRDGPLEPEQVTGAPARGVETLVLRAAKSMELDSQRALNLVYDTSELHSPFLDRAGMVLGHDHLNYIHEHGLRQIARDLKLGDDRFEALLSSRGELLSDLSPAEKAFVRERALFEKKLGYLQDSPSEQAGVAQIFEQLRLAAGGKELTTAQLRPAIEQIRTRLRILEPDASHAYETLSRDMNNFVDDLFETEASQAAARIHPSMRQLIIDASSGPDLRSYLAVSARLARLRGEDVIDTLKTRVRQYVEGLRMCH